MCLISGERSRRRNEVRVGDRRSGERPRQRRHRQQHRSHPQGLRSSHHCHQNWFVSLSLPLSHITRLLFIAFHHSAMHTIHTQRDIQREREFISAVLIRPLFLFNIFSEQKHTFWLSFLTRSLKADFNQTEEASHLYIYFSFPSLDLVSCSLHRPSLYRFFSHSSSLPA